MFDDVACALVTTAGSSFHGVCIDTPGTGFCAEFSAIAAMVTAGEYRISRIVAVWRNQSDGRLYVLPPCGTCREFMRQVDPANIDTTVILGADHAVPLRDFLPYHDWPEPLPFR